MTLPAHPSQPSHSADDPTEQAIAAFEKAWLRGRAPTIDQYCDTDNVKEGAGTLLLELVLIDMEFRFKTAAAGGRLHDALGSQPRLEDYLRLYPKLGPIADLPADVVAEEYRVRQQWGDGPSHDHFLARFPDQLTSLIRRLQAIDRELAADADTAPSVAPRPPSRTIEVDPRAPLPYSDYRIEQHIGSGGMGRVYRATQQSLQRKVALKALHKSRQHDPVAVERFVQEAQLLARLRHPGVIGIHGLGRFPGGGYFLVMDWIDGPDLATRLRTAPLPISEAVRITTAVARAVQYAHEHGIVHCDLKPANILLGENDQVLVADFGFAQLLERHADTARDAPSHGGTVGYCAPEQMTDQPLSTSVAIDVFGLGALLFALIFGRPPPEHSTDTVSGEPGIDSAGLAPSELRSMVPPGLAEICAKCLQHRPGERYGSANEVAVALATIPSTEWVPE